MSWIQAFNQPYPGALQYLQSGGMLPAREQNSCYTGVAQAVGLDPAVYGSGAPRARLANQSGSRARNFQGGVGAIGPAIGLSPMVYGIPFPGYPSLAEQQKVGVTQAESEQWREVYAAQLRDRGVVANPTQESPWPPTAGYGTGQYGSQYGPNQNPREQNAVRRLRLRPARRLSAPAATRIKCEPGRVPCGRVCCYPGNQCINGRCKWPIRHPNAARSDRRLNGVVSSCHDMCEAIAKGQGWDPEDLPESFGNCWANCIAAFTPPEAGSGPTIQAPSGPRPSGRRGRRLRPKRGRKTTVATVSRITNGCVKCGSVFCCGKGMTTRECCELNRPLRRRTGRLAKSRVRKHAGAKSPRSGASDCFGICCGAHEPEGTDCSSKDAKITKPSTWSCMTRCLKVPDPTPGAGGGPSLSGGRPRRVPKGCRTCGIGGICCRPRVCRTFTEPGGGTYSACVDRLRNGGGAR